MINCIRCRCAVLLSNMPRHLAESHGIDIVKGESVMMKRCTICGTGLPAGVLCLEHLLLSTLRLAVKHGTVSDWPPPPPPLPLQVTHCDFMTGNYTSAPGFTWRAQLVAVLSSKNVRLDEGVADTDTQEEQYQQWD